MDFPPRSPDQGECCCVSLARTNSWAEVDMHSLSSWGITWLVLFRGQRKGRVDDRVSCSFLVRPRITIADLVTAEFFRSSLG